MPLSQLKLFQELKARTDTGDKVAEYLQGVLVTSFGKLDRLLRDVRVYFRHFTDHSVDHSLRILHNIALILEPSQYKRSLGSADCLTSVDLYLLIASALVHDVGMVIPEGELAELESEAAFRDMLARWREEATDTEEWKRRGVSRLAIAEYVRRTHPQRSMRMVLDSRLPPQLSEGRLGYWLGKVAAAHGEDFEGVCDQRNFPPSVAVQVSGPLQETCNPRFAALCLRLGDLLDIGTARACPVLRGLSEPLSALSQAHWDQYRDIEVRGLAPNSQISIAGTCPTQDSERLLREWVAWLEREAAEAVLVQNQDARAYRLHLGRIKFDVDPEKDDAGKPKYEFLSFRFNLDERIVFERLFGKSLYGRPELAIRELIQNAIDAQRARLVAELAASTPDWNLEGDDASRRRASLLRDRIKAKRNEFPIRIDITSRTEPSGPRTWLAVRDHGIGMTRDTIEKYLLKVGRSRWSSDPAVAKLGLGSVTAGAFGIGFMSTLMVSDRIVVETQSNLPMENGIRLTLFGWQGYAATEPLGATAPGTTVHVRVNDSFFSSSQDLAAQLAALVPIPDFPLRVVADGTETPVPELDLDPAASEQRPQCVAPIDALGSFVRIAADSGRSSNATVWRGPKTIVALLRKRNPSIRLCQDGIAIPEMALPASRDPEVAILEERGCLVDLRGSSRVPLDLSRNLVEGGNERFWTGEIPNLWNAICASASTDPVALRALGEVATRTLHVSGVQDPLRFAAPGGAFVRGLRSLDAEEIVCVDPYWDLSSEALTKEGATAWLTPDTEIKEVAAELPFELPMLDPTGEFSDYALLGGDGEDDDGSVFRASATLDREWERLTQTFKWVSPASHVPCRLSRKERSGSRKVSQLFAFQASRNWMSVLSPLYGVHELFPKSSVESAAAAARERELSLGDFYVFLLDALFQVGHDDWGRHGPLADALSKVASRLDRRRAERPPPATRAGEESDDEEVRRQVEERLDQDADLYQGIALECDVDALAASWEAEAWEAGTFGSDRRR